MRRNLGELLGVGDCGPAMQLESEWRICQGQVHDSRFTECTVFNTARYNMLFVFKP